MCEPHLRLAPTSALSLRELRAIRDMLDSAYEGEFTDADWEHALGGTHAILLDGGGVAAHGSLVQRRLTYEGDALDAGYIEAVATRAERRGRGYVSHVMGALEHIIRSTYAIGVLGAGDDAARIYAARGWQTWNGSLYALTAAGEVVATPEEQGCVYVFPGQRELDRGKPLCCDWRPGDVW